MKLEVQANVVGYFDFESNIEFKNGIYNIRTFFSKETKEFYIVIGKRVKNYQDYMTKYVKRGNKHILELTSPECYKDIISLLQHIESFGGIDMNIIKINWEDPLITWIPENNEEKGIMPILSHKLNRSYSHAHRIITKNWLSNTVLFSNQLKELDIPLAFFREGSNYYQRFQYQLAFSFFFMMLEYEFSNGQFNSAGMKKEFRNNSILENSIITTIKHLKEEKNKHWIWLENEVSNWNIIKKEKNHIQLDSLGVIEILINARGNTMHANKKSNKNRVIFHESKYESLSFITMEICMYVIIKLRLLPFTCKEEIRNPINK